jgi:anti-anti-sigma factor
MQTSTKDTHFLYPTASWEVEVNLHLHARTFDDVTVLYCEGRIRHPTEVAKLRRKIDNVMPHTRQLILELSGVEIIDSASLGELVMVLLWAQACGCSLKLANARRPVQELLEVTNLASMFEMHSTLNQALVCFQGHAA